MGVSRSNNFFLLRHSLRPLTNRRRRRVLDGSNGKVGPVNQEIYRTRRNLPIRLFLRDPVTRRRAIVGVER